MTPKRKPKVAVWKFASCDGCQLSLLDCEDELLDVVGAVDIAYFPEATRAVMKGPYDVSLVEGSVTTPHDAHRIKDVRKVSKFLMTIGTCATSGGLQALRNYKDVKEFAAYVYQHPDAFQTLDTSTPISAHVKVDYELHGCPINKYQLLEVISALLNGRTPMVFPYSLCMECKVKGNICVMVSRGIPCMGPITHAGCGALCPSYHRGCYSCFGPKEMPNTAALGKWFGERLGMSEDDVVRIFRSFYSGAEPFRQESLAHEK